MDAAAVELRAAAIVVVLGTTARSDVLSTRARAMFSDCDAEALPAAFTEILKHLPPVCEALTCALAQIEQREDDSTWAEVKDSMDQCKAKAGILESIYGKVVPSVAAQRIERYRDAMDEGMKVAPEAHLRTLAEVMTQVSAISPSLQDDGSASGIYNCGSGPQSVNTGLGEQFNNNKDGFQFNHSTFSGFDPLNQERRRH
ncbi:hypothetical protein PG994_014571 [Apiospora phragmitis]|uniref:NACHT-NTPase and P-loop NTPases N-terminal domain-containing protein n=1 Tax=Apiospora phragmitis TaxID=2905665 RepID=A0ABR1T4Q5_9PEZI